MYESYDVNITTVLYFPPTGYIEYYFVRSLMSKYELTLQSAHNDKCSCLALFFISFSCFWAPSHVLLAQERPNTRVIFYALLVSSFLQYTLRYLYFLFNCFEKLDKMPTMHLFYTGTFKMEAYFMFYLQLSRRPKNDVSCYKYHQIPLKTRFISP